MATTAAASSSSSTSTGAGIGVEETADEVKVFRSSAPEEDPNEMAGSSADLNADKQELAMEADIESQADFSQRVNPIISSMAPIPWLSPGNNFLCNLAALSPVFQAAAAQQKLAAMAAQTYAAAYIARLSPHYMNLGAGGALGAFERPPAFSMPCTPSATNGARNGQQQANNLLQMNSPMAGLSGGIGGVSLSADRAASNAQRHHQKAANGRTPKREKAERREKSSGKSVNDKKDGPEHIKKPMNAFMLFMKENRHKYMDECGDKRKQSAELNKELGQIWQKMTRDEQQPYYDMAQRLREEHQKLYPNWTARENYAIHKRVKKRRTRERSLENNEQKKCRARFGVDNQAKWCKHCRRKKRCLNVRDADSPVQVSSTTNPTTPSSMAGPSSGNGAAGFGHLMGMFGPQGQQDSPHSSRKDCGQSTSELSRCSSTTSSASSNMSADEGPEGAANGEKGKMPQNGFKLELLDAPKAHHQAAAPLVPLDLPKPLPNPSNVFPPAVPQQPLMPNAGGPNPNASPFQMMPAPFPFQPNPFMPFGMNFMPNFMKQ